MSVKLVCDLHLLLPIRNEMARISVLNDGSVHRRHVDQLRYHVLNILVNIGVNTSSTPVDFGLDVHKESLYRCSERQAMQPLWDYKHPRLYSSCGGCYGCSKIFIHSFTCTLPLSIRYQCGTLNCTIMWIQTVFWLHSSWVLSLCEWFFPFIRSCKQVGCNTV